MQSNLMVEVLIFFFTHSHTQWKNNFYSKLKQITPKHLFLISIWVTQKINSLPHEATLFRVAKWAL